MSHAARTRQEFKEAWKQLDGRLKTMRLAPLSDDAIIDALISLRDNPDDPKLSQAAPFPIAFDTAEYIHQVDKVAQRIAKHKNETRKSFIAAKQSAQSVEDIFKLKKIGNRAFSQLLKHREIEVDLVLNEIFGTRKIAKLEAVCHIGKFEAEDGFASELHTDPCTVLLLNRHTYPVLAISGKDTTDADLKTRQRIMRAANFDENAVEELKNQGILREQALNALVLMTGSDGLFATTPPFDPQGGTLHMSSEFDGRPCCLAAYFITVDQAKLGS